jgi:hypothetical protein
LSINFFFHTYPLDLLLAQFTYLPYAPIYSSHPTPNFSAKLKIFRRKDPCRKIIYSFLAFLEERKKSNSSQLDSTLINIGQRWSTLVNAGQRCFNIGQRWSTLVNAASILVNAGQRWSTLVNAGQRWSTLVNAGQRWSTLVNAASLGRRWWSTLVNSRSI